MISERPDRRGPDAPAAPYTALDHPQPPHRRRIWPWIVGLVMVALIVFFLLPHHGKESQEKGEAKGKGAGGKGGEAARPVPVLAAAARTKDVGVYLTGLGTVNALATVTLHSRVDGQLVRVGFREGQLVH